MSQSIRPLVPALVLCAAVAAMAQDAAPPAPGELRDPTAGGPAVQRPGEAASAGDERGPAPAAFPAMSLRALVAARGKPAAALLEVEGVLVQVEAGTTVPFSRGEIRVDAVGPLDVRVTLSGTPRTAVLR